MLVFLKPVARNILACVGLAPESNKTPRINDTVEIK